MQRTKAPSWRWNNWYISAFMETKNGTWKIKPAKKSSSVNHILQTYWLFKIPGWPFNKQVLPDFFNQQYHAYLTSEQQNMILNHTEREYLSYVAPIKWCSVVARVSFRNMIWNHSHCNPLGQCCTEKQLPFTHENQSLPRKRTTKTNNTMFWIIFKVGSSFLAYILPPILGPGNKSPGHKLPKLQIFGKDIVLISLEALN